MIKNLIFAFFCIVLSVFILARNVSASEGEGGTLRHAYKPFTVEQTKWTRARVDNFSAQPQKRLVCVEAFNVATNAKTHLGCLWVDLASHNSMDMWAMEFDVPTAWLSPGTYNVVYTYQDENNMWHRIKSVNMQLQDGMYVAR